MELKCDKVELKLRQGGNVEGGAWLGEVGHQQVCLWALSLVLTPPSLRRLSSGSCASQCELLCYDRQRPLKLAFSLGCLYRVFSLRGAKTDVCAMPLLQGQGLGSRK